MEQPVINRPSAGFPASDPPDRGSQLFQVKGDRRSLDLHHPDLPAVPDSAVGQQVFLPPVEAVHADSLHRTQPGPFPGKLLQEAHQCALSRPGRSREHHKDPPSGGPLHCCQFFQERHKDFMDRPLAVAGGYFYSVDLNRIFCHRQSLFP